MEFGSMTLQPKSILTQLQQQGILDSKCVLGAQMSGTTVGSVYIIQADNQPLYVLKIESPGYVKSVTDFLNIYQGPLIPTLHFSDSKSGYFIYEYITGEVNHDKGSKSKWLADLANSLVNRYEQRSANQGWGWLDESLSDSWSAFLQRSIAGARSIIGDVLPEEDHDFVSQIPAAVYGSKNPDAYLLHGDCGVHNFIFDSSVLKGVIDPIPMIGPPHHDFIFAFCSSPDNLTMDTFLQAADSLKPSIRVDRAKLIEEVLVQLYCRIGTCLKYHSHHLPDYLEAWAYWKHCREETAE
jgi:hypothetical protein